MRFSTSAIKYSPMKVVGIVFLIVTLIIAVSLTNNTVRQMISSSFAFDSECASKGSPSARKECQNQKNSDKIAREQRTAQIKSEYDALQRDRDELNEELGFLKEDLESDRINRGEYVRKEREINEKINFNEIKINKLKIVAPPPTEFESLFGHFASKDAFYKFILESIKKQVR